MKQGVMISISTLRCETHLTPMVLKRCINLASGSCDSFASEKCSVLVLSTELESFDLKKKNSSTLFYQHSVILSNKYVVKQSS